MTSWKTLEKSVRVLAELKWGGQCVPDQIIGQKIDGVIRLSDRHIIAIEITENVRLDKIRADCAKLSLLASKAAGDGIFVQPVMVVQGNVTEGMRDTARESKIDLYRFEEFASDVLGQKEYVRERSEKPFGSAVTPGGARIDKTAFVDIQYIDSRGNRYSIEDIARHLTGGHSLVLIGEFGTGKSRCLMETFNMLQTIGERPANVLAINLRDCWGLENMGEIINRHMGNLGLSKFFDPVVRSINRGNHILLIDGFDELASQSWDGNLRALSQNRKKSLVGVRNLLEENGGAGVMITGREHYFQSDEEMFDCLGLPEDTLVLKCPDEFTQDEAKRYLDNFKHIDSRVLNWIPRKPLICQLYVGLGTGKMKELEEASDSEVAFFENSLDEICRREVKISDSLNAESVKGILLKIAENSRLRNAAVERITQEDLHVAFAEVVKTSPGDASSTILQRLPYLGRVDSESNDRVFVDDYAKDGLRGLGVASWINRPDGKVPDKKWVVPLDEFGLRVVSEKVAEGAMAVRFAKSCVRSSSPNDQAAADAIAARILSVPDKFDGGHLQLSDVHMPLLDLSEKSISNLYFSSSFIDVLKLGSSSLNDVVFNQCVIGTLEGLASNTDLKQRFDNWDVEVSSFDQSFVSSSLRHMDLTDPQKMLLSILQKLFRQPGRGRKASALLRGSEQFWDKKSADRILKSLIDGDLISYFKASGERVYTPNRSQAKRVEDIFRDLKNSDDPIWEQAV